MIVGHGGTISETTIFVLSALAEIESGRDVSGALRPRVCRASAFAADVCAQHERYAIGLKANSSKGFRAIRTAGPASG
jgi:hypothetical protein